MFERKISGTNTNNINIKGNRDIKKYLSSTYIVSPV